MARMDMFTIAPADAQRPRNDHASMVELRDGRLMLAYIEFCGGDELIGHDHAPSSIVSVISGDGGRTWTDRRVLAATRPGETNVYHPCLLRLKSGDILFFHLRYQQLKEGEPTQVASCISRSTDDGRTFSDPEQPATLQGVSDCNGLVMLSTGRIILPTSRTLGEWCSLTASGEAGDHSICLCCHSDDNGRTWAECKSTVDLPRRGAMEPHVAELRDGRLLMTMRTELGAVFQSHSADGGDTWSLPQTTGLKAPESMPCLVRIPRTGDLLLVWNDSPFEPKYDHSGRRTPLTVAISTDDGRTWKNRKNLETDPAYEFTNPGCHFTSAGKVLITYVASKMDNPNPPGRLGRSRMPLKAVLADLEWFYES